MKQMKKSKYTWFKVKDKFNYEFVFADYKEAFSSYQKAIKPACLFGYNEKDEETMIFPK